VSLCLTLVIVHVQFTEKVLLEDIYFGDVWLCGGQSNMQFTVNLAFNATTELALANNYPHIRLFTVGQSTTSDEVIPSSLNEGIVYSLIFLSFAASERAEDCRAAVERRQFHYRWRQVVAALLGHVLVLRQAAVR
jgi:hypothetical protein